MVKLDAYNLNCQKLISTVRSISTVSKARSQKLYIILCLEKNDWKM